MAFILNLETSTTVCSVSVTKDSKMVSLREQTDAKSHASQLIPFISEVLKESGIKPHDLSAIAVSKGPGSYTGLRIGVSTAKGLAYALNLPLIAVDTLYCMASGFLDNNPALSTSKGIFLCPMIDARRMEVYSAVYDIHLKELRRIEAEIINPASFMPLLTKNTVYFFGNGAMKCRDLISQKSAIFIEGFHPSASYFGKISFQQLENRLFENLAYFEPFYLKDFIATTPVNKFI
jgi:tRNA threonylcarbamoyladenosine biosynthesis protein TsaB